jgi:hypothetical protein
MDKAEAPIGQRFSFVYIPRSLPLPDSERMRNRLFHLFGELDLWPCKDIIEGELGLHLPRLTTSNVYWKKFFSEFELRDILDTITIAYSHARRSGNGDNAEKWKSTVCRIFKEEHMRYKLDERCGVHLLVDAEYEHNIAATISTLQNSRYTAALQAFNNAQSALDRSEPDCREALRGIFEAIEIVFKMTYKGEKRIGVREIKDNLLPAVKSIYSCNGAASDAAAKFVDSLSQWVSAVHFFRHGQPSETNDQPPIGLAIALMSSGVSFLRWLVEINLTIHTGTK